MANFVTLYAIRIIADEENSMDEDTYFVRYNSQEGRSEYSTDVRDAKFFTNKFDIRLRPHEMIVQVDVPLENITTSAPFRPSHRRYREHQERVAKIRNSAPDRSAVTPDKLKAIVV